MHHLLLATYIWLCKVICTTAIPGVTKQTMRSMELIFKVNSNEKNVCKGEKQITVYCPENMNHTYVYTVQQDCMFSLGEEAFALSPVYYYGYAYTDIP